MAEDNKDNPEGDELVTEKADARIKYLSTLVAGVTALSFPILVFIASFQFSGNMVVNLGAIPDPWFYVYAILAASSFSYTLDVKLLKRVTSVFDTGGN